MSTQASDQCKGRNVPIVKQILAQKVELANQIEILSWSVVFTFVQISMEKA